MVPVLTDAEKEIARLQKAAGENLSKPGKLDQYTGKSQKAEAAALQKDLISKKTLDEAALRGAGNIAAADAVKSELAELQAVQAIQRKLNVGYEEAVGLARIQAAEEKAITRQKAEQAALAKAGIFSSHTKNELLTLGRLGLTGGNMGRSVSSLVGSALKDIFAKSGAAGGAAAGASAVAGEGASAAAGGAAAGEIATAGAGLAGALAGVALVLAPIIAGLAFLKFERGQKEWGRQEEYKTREEQAGDERAQEIARSPLGSSSGAFQSEISDETEVRKRKAMREKLDHDARHGILGWIDKGIGTHMATKGIGWWKPKGARAIKENEDEINRAERDKGAQAKILKKQWEIGGEIDLDILRDTNEHSVHGMKKRLVDTAGKHWVETYRRYFAETGSDKIAKEAADLTVKNDQWKDAQRAASALVNARSGAADIAQAAHLSQTFYIPDQTEQGKKLDHLAHIIRSGMGKNYDALTAASTKVY